MSFNNSATTVELVIKNFSSRVEDYRLRIELDKTVEDLKEALARDYPQNPPPACQKLVFSGRLLQGATPLSQVFSQRDITVPQTIHLVVSPRSTTVPLAPQHHFVYRPVNANPPVAFDQRPQQVQQPQLPPQPDFPDANGGGNERERDAIFLCIKLAFIVYILSQGGSISKLVFLSFGAIIIFLYQTGRLRIAANLRVHNHQQPGQQLPNNADQQPQENQDQNQNQPANQHVGGVIKREISAFLLPFFYSLFPSWTPGTTFANPPPPLNPVEQAVPELDQQVQAQPVPQEAAHAHID